ncbi:Uncharacterized protein SCF082_LOCUS23836 [Durusdinium trenchii]|uniref:Protein xylosyltransferase n=1 Tax=Durusdinium trenchii TaxID=1381693 RepID=A0ABP0LPR0_9DINO
MCPSYTSRPMHPCWRMLMMVSALIPTSGLIHKESSKPMEILDLLADNSSTAGGWNFCANQWEECVCHGRVRWGYGRTWKVIDPPLHSSSLTVMCSIKHLQDVLPGESQKHCQCQGQVMSKHSFSSESTAFTEGGISKIALKDSDWIFCSNQWQECQCNNHVRWGKGERWKYLSPKKLGSLFSVKCDVNALGDPVPGEDGKHCECLVARGSLFERELNPMLLSQKAADSYGARIIASCDIFEAGKANGPEGRAQWQAVEPFCSKAWEEKAEADRSLHSGSLQKLMQARVDARFETNYLKLVDEDGWFDKAFVNYFAGAPGSKHANMTEQLIRSVHMFSENPIVVLHLGSRAPDTWTPKRFPRLLLVHAAPMGADSHRSFNFNKLRSFLISRARVGVELDSDQFVGPGVDYMFEMTEKEIDEHYSLPIMPVHFYSFTQADTPQNVWWQRYCPDPPACKPHTMRWSHAHPTWTFWSLPFIGRWLRRHFRDELLLATANHAASLAVSQIPEDEDLLNVATWEERGTKQWCKFDNDYHEFVDMLSWTPQDGHHTTTGDIASDPKFYPHGAAKAFFTAHNCKDPIATAKMLDEIQSRWENGLYPPSTITYKGQFWESGDDLRKAYPELPCIF